MDHNYIPFFALLRHGTVITRLDRMEKFSGHFWERCQQVDGKPEGVRRAVRMIVDPCEHCTRTRLVSQCSDCDSALMGKCRTYRRRAAKSRYVNVCAAVCLLLLVGGLTPQSAAAPPHTSRMENESWSNPCDYDLSNMSTREFKYTPRLAKIVATQAQVELDSAKELQEAIEKANNPVAELHTFRSFPKLLEAWKDTEWLRSHHWFKDEVLPKSKVFGSPVVNKTELNDLVASKKALPLLTKAMKALGRGLNAVSNSLNNNDPRELHLKPKLQTLSNNIRYILCLTFDVLRAQKMEMLPLPDKEVKTYANQEDVITDVFLIYRDTINFLEYIDEYFTVMNKTVLE